MERLKKIGTLPQLSSQEIATSRLGLGFEKLDRAVFDPNKAYDKVAATGTKLVRLQSGWARTEKTEGVYDFLWLDEIVDNFLSRSIEPWLCLCYGNPVYTEAAKGSFGAVGYAPTSTERELSAWLAYVKATVEHFKDRIKYFEIWNEPDCFYAWHHTDGEPETREQRLKNALDYGKFAIATSIAIKEVFPEAEVIGLCHGNVDNLEWANVAFSTGLYQHIDYVSFHCYTHDELKRRDRIQRFKYFLESYNPKIKFIQGETGAPSRSDGTGAMMSYAWTPVKQMKALLRGIIIDLAMGVEFTSYFSTMDMIEAHTGKLNDKASYLDYGYFGILGCDFDENGIASGEYYEKPSYYAFSALTSLLHGDSAPENIAYNRLCLESNRVNGEDCCDSTVVIEGFRLEGDRRALIYWNAVDLLTLTYEGTISFEIYGKIDSVRLVDLRDGGIYELPELMIERIDGGVRLKNLPITDCPLAVLYE
ncbi:MAG: beta-galactosidase [Clostridia bacterium]|nr:beta-galactosidase [Clostridia bacterium]